MAHHPIHPSIHLLERPYTYFPATVLLCFLTSSSLYLEEEKILGVVRSHCVLGYDLAEPHEPLLVGGAVVASHVVVHVGCRRQVARVVDSFRVRRVGGLHGGCRHERKQHPCDLVHGWPVDGVPLGAQQGQLEGLPD